MKLFIGNKVYSSWSLRPWIVMKAFGIPFEETVVQLRETDTRDRILAHSPSGKVPALIDEGTTAWDSLAIMEYLADKFPNHAIWPKDRLVRAHARCGSAEMHSGFQALRNACSMNVTRRFKARDRGEAVAADVARVTQIWREAREKFGAKTGKPFLYGEFSAADGMYAPVVSRFHGYSIAVDPVSQAYIDAMLGHSAYKTWLAGAVAETWGLVNGEDTETVIEDLRAKKA
jgi:glutathione S-transferase